MKRPITLLAIGCLLYVGCLVSAFAQPSCPIATTTPTAARDEARLSWTAPAQNTDGSAIVAPLTYRVYQSTGSGSTNFTVQCQTQLTSISLMARPVGTHNYRVTASSPGSNESGPSNVVNKTIVAATPNPPTNMTLLEQLVALLRRLFSRFG